MKTQNNLPPTSKTHEPPIYDVWDHYELLRLHLKWFKDNRSNLIRYIPCNELDREILDVRLMMKSMERKMLIEFEGDMLNLTIMQKPISSDVPIGKSYQL